MMAEQILQTTIFGNYYLLKMLGYGSVAEILLSFKANRYGCRKFYIIKKLFDSIATDKDKLQGFIQEGEIATSLSHQNIVCGYEYGAVELAENKSYYLAMEYVFGKNLSQIQRKSQNNALPVEVVVSIVQSVARGLMHAHTYCDPFTLQEQCIIHKDISPDNIIISYNGEIKISDFGISKKGHEESLPGKIAGKLSYMSPEQRQNKDLDCRSDIYSLGVVFWECLTGIKLYNKLSDQEAIQNVVNPDIASPCELNSNVPVGVGDICMKCLEPDPENRFQSVQELYEALNGSSDIGYGGTANVKNYILSQFAEEYKNEAQMLLQIQKAYIIENTNNTNKAEASFVFPEPFLQQFTTAEESGIPREGSAEYPPDDYSVTDKKNGQFNLLPEISHSASLTDTRQTTNEIIASIYLLEQDLQQLTIEKTVVIEPFVEARKKTAVIDNSSLNVSVQDLTKVTEAVLSSTDILKQENSLNILANSEDSTRTDYEIEKTNEVNYQC
jgi:serine/threonine protein kinase